MDFAPVPPGYVDLNNARDIGAGKLYSVIGVCVDFRDATKSKGTDYMLTFTLHDTVWTVGLGMSFRFFNRDEKQLPIIQNQGDIVILRNVKTISYDGSQMGISNWSSTWIVLPHAELQNLNSLESLKAKANWSKKGIPTNGGSEVAMPNEAELKYAKWIAEQEDPSTWPRLAGVTRLQLDHIMASSGGQAAPTYARGYKFRLIKDLELDTYQGKYSYVDLLGEVRKIYQPGDDRTDVYVTDYTEHQLLYNYSYNSNEDGGMDGDEYGYIQSLTRKWPGPWGKMTLMVTLWESHSNYARKHLTEGKFVRLRNVQIQMDKSGARLEGNCRGDHFNPTKVNVEVRNAREGKGDEQMEGLLIRKREYEARAKAENMRFVRNAQDTKKRKVVEVEEPEEAQKSKKTKTRNRKKKENRGKSGAEQAPAENGAAKEENALARPNVNVRCNRVEIPCTTVVDILDPNILERTTVEGHKFQLPFQNCKYKSYVKVVDFFPDNIADFAAPRKVTDYDVLSDHEGGDEDSDVDLTQAQGGDDVRWEWCFYLLVEDARGAPARKDRDEAVSPAAQMELMVSDTDGDFLLKMDACNFRHKNNSQQLAMLKEKLFHLWGDLQERKEESNGTAEALSVKPNARPFECLIKEYGVPARNFDERRGASYDRTFRLFGTTI